jgi:hypothetical protein
MPERDCGRVHTTIDEAIAHARQSLAASLPNPVWGRKGGQIANVGRVIGYESQDKRKRYRLDYDPVKGVHVNEEDWNRPVDQQKVVHRVRFSMHPADSDVESAWHRTLEGWMQLYWNKWTSRYDKPAEVLEAEEEVDRRRRGQ